MTPTPNTAYTLAREDEGLSHGDWITLSRTFNLVAYRCMSQSAEFRINEYLKSQITAEYLKEKRIAAMKEKP